MHRGGRGFVCTHGIDLRRSPGDGYRARHDDHPEDARADRQRATDSGNAGGSGGPAQPVFRSRCDRTVSAPTRHRSHSSFTRPCKHRRAQSLVNNIGRDPTGSAQASHAFAGKRSEPGRAAPDQGWPVPRGKCIGWDDRAARETISGSQDAVARFRSRRQARIRQFDHRRFVRRCSARTRPSRDRHGVFLS